MSGDRIGGGRWRWSSEFLQFSTVSIDAALAFGSALAAALVYRGFLPDRPQDVFIELGALATLLFVGFMASRGAYRVSRLSEARLQVGWVLQGWAFVFFNLAWIGFLLKAMDAFSRGTVLLWFVVGGFVLAAAHGFGARALSKAFASRALSLNSVVVVTVADEVGAAAIVDRLTRGGVGVAALSRLDPAALPDPETDAHVATVVQRALAGRQLDGIWVFAALEDRLRIERLRAALGRLPVAIHLFTDRATERMLARPRLRIGDLVGLELQRAPLSRFDRAAKRMLDVVGASAALVLLAPLMVLTAIAIAVESGFPVLFRQHRKGFGSRPFAILKFRSMTVAENGDRVVQASRSDRRVTRVGRVIRRTSIDELPQLFNVLKGDMSLVGPRPHALAHDDHYGNLIADYALRQHVKPGITGWAQIKGLRGETREVDQMRARVEHDLWYIDNWSIGLDIRILILTMLVVLFDDNAY